MITKIKTSYLVILIAFALFFALPANAQQSQEIINQQDWVTRQQQNKIEEEKRIKEQDTIKKERDLQKKEEEESNQTKATIDTKIAKCFIINEVQITGTNKILSAKQQQKLVKPFLNKCLDNQRLFDLTNSIANYFKELGYATVQAIPAHKQNIVKGILEININLGTIEKIILNDNKDSSSNSFLDGLSDKTQKITAFGNIEGDILNLNDINQGLYQINRLPSNNARMTFESGSADGKSKVLITNNKKFPARANIGYDNLGNDFTGIHRTNFSGGLDNMLFLNDNINLNYSTNLNDDNQTKDIKSFTSGISVPLGYNTFSYDYSRTEFRGTNQGVDGPLRLNGYSDRNNVTIDRVLLSKGNLRISGNTSLTTKESASYLNQEKINTSERKLTIGNIGFTISNYFKNGTNLYLKPTYYKGLKILNAKQDNSNLTADIPKAQFDYFKLYASLFTRFLIPKTEIPFTLSSEMDSQYSKQTLFGSEQFSVGGYYSVRGFRENYITGDNGYYFRNKANVNIGSLIAPFLKNQSNESRGFLSKSLVHLNKFSLEPFYDYGYVKNKYIDNGADGRLVGAGIKTLFNGGYFNASLTYSAVINKSKLITSTEKENKMIYFEVSASCC